MMSTPTATGRCYSEGVTSSSSAGLSIREALPDERAQATAITLAAYAEYARLLRPEYWESYRQHIAASLEDVSTWHQLVAVRADRALVGTALYCPPGTSFGEDVETAAVSVDCPEVRLLAVAPAGRGAGVGRALMEACVARARASGAAALVLHTMEMMKAARSIYEKMGFVRDPELDFQPARDWYVEGFRLDLAPS